MKSQEVINKEIEALKEIKPKVRERSLFGDNHHDAIDAQIEVLEGLVVSEDDIYDQWSEENILDAAREAYEWKFDRSGHDSLVSGWEKLT
jgi:hypothetical protein